MLDFSAEVKALTPWVGVLGVVGTPPSDPTLVPTAFFR